MALSCVEIAHSVGALCYVAEEHHEQQLLRDGSSWYVGFMIPRRGGRLLGVECKCADAPRLTPSMKIALADLDLDRVAVLYPGERRYSLADRVEPVPAGELAEHGRLFRESQ